MSERNEFDDLARRKLEERDFRFHEADWLEAQRLIAQQRSSGTWRTWIVAGVGLALIGTSVWFLTTDRSAVQERASVAVITTNERSTTPASPATITEEPKGIESDRTGTLSDVAVSDELNNNAAPSSSRRSNSEARRSIVQPEQGSTAQQQGLSRSTMQPFGTSSASPVAGRTAVPQDPSIASVDVERSASLQDVVATTVTGEESIIYPVVGTSAPVITVPEVGNAATGTGSEQPPSEIPISPISTTEPETPTTSLANTTPADQPANGTQERTVAPFTADTSTTTTASSVSLNDPTTTQDSATTTAAVPPPPPLITPDSPWEIVVLFGGLLSRSTYTGSNSAEWIDGQTGRWSPAFGGEVMHMGRNFGIGSGLHYSTYQEDLHIAERSLSTTLIQDSNYFQPFQTTILYVVGNVVIDGEQYYVTESRDTTLNILVLGTTSHTTTRKLIDARDVTNRVSYVEVPLLLDAHLVQGAWAIGIRGGPTVGLLNGRRGAVPNAAFDGYTDFATEQFRSPVFGFTARAYLRYRCVNGWSVGVEPTWRGHFGNALNSGELTRKSSAMGGMISVSYRLR